MSPYPKDPTRNPMAAEIGIHKVTWEIVDRRPAQTSMADKPRTVSVSLPYVSILEDEYEHVFREAAE